MALALGGLMPFAFSPYDYAWLAIPVLAGWLWLICQGSAFRVGYAFGFGWFGFGAWWLAPTLHTFGHLPWLAAAFCVMLVGAVMALLPALWAWTAAKVAGKSGWILVSFPLAAVAFEWLRGHIFTGLPWTALGNLMLDTPAVGWAAWFGVYGMALLPALIAASLLLILTPEAKKWGGFGLLAATLLILLAPRPEVADGGTYRAALVQGNIPQDQKWDAAFVNETMSRYAGLSAEAAQSSDVIIWPEAAVPFFLSRATGWDEWLRGEISSWRTPLLFGGLKVTGESTANNGLFAHDPQQTERQFAGKQHLVPFGEYVPAWIPFLHVLVPEIADFRPAEDSGVVAARGIHYGALICYESLFPEQARLRVEHGAQVLVNITNDAWYGTTPAAWQHFQAARMRAVETGRYVLRAANTGITAIIGPDGKVIKSLPWWTTAALQGEFRLIDTRTRYVQWGDAPLLVTLLLFIIPLVRGRSVYE
ncbi:MAG: apolipoprotein N-acyltransferase [Zetaproteobacteria bacterium CG1_02_53_45]|nr:MAG: apolipoprotein N-acyltransferase [Zetaproteobacteria bacterium CG1_02_53_45]